MDIKREYPMSMSNGEDAPRFNESMDIPLVFMPVRCYTCGKIIPQKAIEKKWVEEVGRGIDKSDAYVSIYEHFNFHRICCKRMILQSPVLERLYIERSYDQIADLFDRHYVSRSTTVEMESDA